MDNKIPKISNNVIIVPFDNGGYLVHHKILGHRLNINDTIYKLLSLIDGILNIEEIILAFKEKYSIEIDKTKVIDILYSQLAKYHIVENTDYEYKQKEKPTYLKLSFTVLRKNWIDGIVSKMGFLFSKAIFYPVFFMSLFFILITSIFNLDVLKSSLNEVNASTGVAYFIVFAVVIILHEFGHAAACNKLGADHGDIGFGFYILSPVMYADVSDAWKLKRSDRIIVNLAGIYIQLIIASILLTLHIITNNNFLLVSAFGIGGLSILYNLNPFFRTDGYWVLSDYTGIANLRENSTKSLKTFFKKRVEGNLDVFSLKNILLALYALISISFIFVFLFVILIKSPNSILNYPYDLIEYVQSVFATKTLNQIQLKQLLLPTLFFVVLFRYGIKIFKTKVLTSSSIDKKEFLMLVLKITLATVFFLSAVGKTLDFNAFYQKIMKFEFIIVKLIPYLILFVEYALALGIIIIDFARQTAKISIIFLVFMTISYSFGHFFLGIEKCDCFGYFKFLTPSNYFFFIVKNSLLILLSIYIYKNSNRNVEKQFIKTTISVITILLLSFFVFKTEVRLVSGFAMKNQGKTIQDLGLEGYNQLNNNKFWFIFSPKCKHCLYVIPKIEKAKNENNLSLVGITSIKNKEELKKLTIGFPVKTLNSNEILRLTKKVPKIFEIKNDTIQKVLNIKEFLKLVK